MGESGSAQETARRIPALRPDVAVLDGRLPDGSGIEVCRQIRSRDPAVRALILTLFDDDSLFAAIMAGAQGFVLKQTGGQDVVDAVRRVGRGQSLLDLALGGLTPQELVLLNLIGRGLTNREIAAETYLVERTVFSAIFAVCRTGDTLDVLQ